MLPAIRKDVLVSLVAAAVIALVVIARDRYAIDPVATHFSTVEVRRPAKSMQGTDQPSTTVSASRVLRLFVRNNTSQNVDLRAIEVAGVKSVEGYSAALDPSGDRGDATGLLAARTVGAGAVVELRSTTLTLSPKQQLALFLWADFYGTPSVQVQTSAGNLRATEGVFVVGTEKAFATYWRLNLLLVALLALAVFYFYRLSRTGNDGKATKAQSPT